MKTFHLLSAIFFVIALALQLLVVKDADKGWIAGFNARNEARAEQGIEMADNQSAIADQNKKGFMREQRNDLRNKVEKTFKGKVSVPQLALGSFIFAFVLWGVGLLRREPRSFGVNLFVIIVFCLVRWLNFL